MQALEASGTFLEEGCDLDLALDDNAAIQFTGTMKATIEVPDELYRQVKAKSALEGRAIREVAVELFEHYVDAGAELGAGRRQRPEQPAQLDGEPLPPWFGALKKYARKAKRHDMESIRQSIGIGLAKERGL